MWPVDGGSKRNADAAYNESQLLEDVWQKPIEQIVPGDKVVSFNGDGKLVPGIVDKLFRNTTQEFVQLTFDNLHDTLVATPGHRFLTGTGGFMEIGHMLRLGGENVRLVDPVQVLSQLEQAWISLSRFFWKELRNNPLEPLAYSSLRSSPCP